MNKGTKSHTKAILVQIPSNLCNSNVLNKEILSIEKGNNRVGQPIDRHSFNGSDVSIMSCNQSCCVTCFEAVCPVYVQRMLFVWVS